MKIIKETVNKLGKRVVTVELADRESLMSFHPDQYYKLGDPLDMIVFGTAIIDSWRTVWCQYEQRWIV